MKTRIFPIALLSVVLFGCEKDPITVDDGRLYPVSIKVDGFAKVIEELDSKALPQTLAAEDIPEHYPEALRYFLYDETGKLMYDIEQFKDVEVPQAGIYYGELKYNLPLGTYKVVVVGSGGGLYFPDSAHYSTASLRPAGDFPRTIDEIFYKEIEFTVDGEHDVDETVVLERIVAALEVELTEMVTDEWAGYPNVVYTSVNSFPFDPDGEYKMERGVSLPRVSGNLELWTTTKFVYRGYVLPDRSGNFNPEAEITIPGHYSNIVGYRYFEDLTIDPNHRLTLTGSLTGTYNWQHTGVTVDSAWAGSKVIEFDGQN